MGLIKIKAQYQSRCRYCGTEIPVGAKCLYDPDGSRGKKIVCQETACLRHAKADEGSDPAAAKGSSSSGKRPAWLPGLDLLRQMGRSKAAREPDASDDPSKPITVAQTYSLGQLARTDGVSTWTRNWSGHGTAWVKHAEREDLIMALASGCHPSDITAEDRERLIKEAAIESIQPEAQEASEAEAEAQDEAQEAPAEVLIRLPLPEGATGYQGQVAGVALPSGWGQPDALPAGVRWIPEDPHWIEPEVTEAMRAIASGETVLVWGPAGGGKTTLAEQIAARSGRPFARVVMNRTAVFEEIVGEVDPSHPEGWRPGILVDAIQTPGCIILLDEIWALRPDWSQWVTQLLDSGVIQTSARRYESAPGVTFVLADNTSGHGASSAATSRYHREAAEPSILSRVAWAEELRGLHEPALVRVLMGRTGCPKAAAQAAAALIVKLGQEAQEKDWSTELSVRDAVHFVRALMRGTPAEKALEGTILAQATWEDREAVRLVVEAVTPLYQFYTALRGGDK